MSVPAPPIAFDVGMNQPASHYLEITLTLSDFARPALELMMPVWTPGSYLVREFARNVEGFSAEGEAGPLAWQKTSKNTWRVQTRGGRTVVRYRVYAFEASVRTSFLDDSRASLKGASIFMIPEGELDSPIVLRLHPPSDWTRISTSLDPVAGLPNTFSAPDFDTLVDSPIEIGNQDVFEFEVRGVRHTLSLTGGGNHDSARLVHDTSRIVEAVARLFGDIPYARYAFLVHLAATGGGGLEHASSCSILVSRWSFRPDESYFKILSLLAHEHIHAWNGKRLRPDGLGPFDYARENYTRQLWFTEGITDYYADLVLVRAGVLTAAQYLARLGHVISGYLATPGRLAETVADASFDAWIKFYRRDEHSPNAAISYYTKGHMVALLLDLEIRRSTQGARSLDDVLRLLYRRYAIEAGRGFTEAELRTAFAEVAGPAPSEILDRYVYDTVEIDFDRFLGHAGLALAGPPAWHAAQGYLGISTRAIEGRLTVSAVVAGTPAFTGGLNVHDELIALDGWRLSAETFAARVEEKPPGTEIELAVSRGGRMRTLRVRLGGKPVLEHRLVRAGVAGETERMLYASWLGSDWAELEEAQKEAGRPQKDAPT